MLDRISELVSTIVIIIVLATFLDLLLPEGSIKRYVKLFIGLLILLTILNPVVSLIDDEMAYKLSSQTDFFMESISPEATRKIISRGENIKESELEAINERYENQLKSEVSRLVAEYFNEYDLFSLNCSYNEEWGEDFGEIKSLKIILIEHKINDQKDPKDRAISNVYIEEIEKIQVDKKNEINEKEKEKQQKQNEKKDPGNLVSLFSKKKELEEKFVNRLMTDFSLSREDISIRVKEK